jgi:putative Mg2+ transporter-C (MgtC) family protein
MRDSGNVRGLTTAASIWIAAAIGLAVGAGFYAGSVLATLISLIAIELFRDIEKKYIHKEGEEK